MKKQKFLAAMLAAVMLASNISVGVSAETIKTTSVTVETLSSSSKTKASTKIWDGKSALSKGAAYTLKSKVTIKKDLVIPTGCTLTLEKGAELKVNKGVKLTVSGTMQVKGSLINNGELTISKGGKLTNYSSVSFGTGKVTINGKYYAFTGSKTSGEAKFTFGKSAAVVLGGTTSSKQLKKKHESTSTIAQESTIKYKGIEVSKDKNHVLAVYKVNKSEMCVDFTFKKDRVSTIKIITRKSKINKEDTDLVTYKNLADFAYFLTGGTISSTSMNTTTKSTLGTHYSITMSKSFTKNFEKYSVDEIRFAIKLLNGNITGKTMTKYKNVLSSSSVIEAIKANGSTDLSSKVIFAENLKNIAIKVDDANKPTSIFIYANENTELTYQIYTDKTKAKGTIYAGTRFRGWGQGLDKEPSSKEERLLTAKDDIKNIYGFSTLAECDEFGKYSSQKLTKQDLSKPKEWKSRGFFTPETLNLRAGQCYELVVSSSNAGDIVNVQFKSKNANAIGKPSYDPVSISSDSKKRIRDTKVTGIYSFASVGKDRIDEMAEFTFGQHRILINCAFDMNAVMTDLSITAISDKKSSALSMEELNYILEILTGGYGIDTDTAGKSSDDESTYYAASVSRKYISDVKKADFNKFVETIAMYETYSGTLGGLKGTLSPDKLK